MQCADKLGLGLLRTKALASISRCVGIPKTRPMEYDEKLCCEHYGGCEVSTRSLLPRLTKTCSWAWLECRPRSRPDRKTWPSLAVSSGPMQALRDYYSQDRQPVSVDMAAGSLVICLLTEVERLLSDSECEHNRIEVIEACVAVSVVLQASMALAAEGRAPRLAEAVVLLKLAASHPSQMAFTLTQAFRSKLLQLAPGARIDLVRSPPLQNVGPRQASSAYWRPIRFSL